MGRNLVRGGRGGRKILKGASIFLRAARVQKTRFERGIFVPIFISFFVSKNLAPLGEILKPPLVITQYICIVYKEYDYVTTT